MPRRGEYFVINAGKNKTHSLLKVLHFEEGLKAFFIRNDKILKNNHPCSGSLSYALPATNVVSPSSHSLLTKLTQPSMTFPKPNMSKCAFKWDENNVVFVADYS